MHKSTLLRHPLWKSKGFIAMLFACFLVAGIRSHAIGSEQSVISQRMMDKLQESTYVPPDGFVPDAETAKKIAEAVWLPMYGAHIYKKQPFVAHLVGDDWYVKGTLKQPPSPQMVARGGVPYARIRKSDGKVLAVMHTR